MLIVVLSSYCAAVLNEKNEIYFYNSVVQWSFQLAQLCMYKEVLFGLHFAFTIYGLCSEAFWGMTTQHSHVSVKGSKKEKNGKKPLA